MWRHGPKNKVSKMERSDRRVHLMTSSTSTSDVKAVCLAWGTCVVMVIDGDIRLARSCGIYGVKNISSPKIEI